MTVLQYCNRGLLNYKRGKTRYTTTEALHNFIAGLPVRFRDLPEEYVTPPGCEPIVTAYLESSPYGFTVPEASRILEVSKQRVYRLIQLEKLTLVVTPFGQHLITYDSLREHLLRVELWHAKVAFNKAKREMYPGLIEQAHNQAYIEKRRKIRKEKKLAERHARSGGKAGRPVGSVGKKKRQKKVKLDIFETPSDEYELK